MVFASKALLRGISADCRVSFGMQSPSARASPKLRAWPMEGCGGFGCSLVTSLCPQVLGTLLLVAAPTQEMLQGPPQGPGSGAVMGQ